VEETIEFLGLFAEETPHARKAIARLRWLKDVGLGYLKTGQPINTLSGGESQRLKLAYHLAEANLMRNGEERTREGAAAPVRGPKAKRTARSVSLPFQPTLFIFDEPTTGLHFHDVHILLQALQRLVKAGHSLLVIEHNLDVIRSADHVIDLGPEGGDEGGRLVVAGTPGQVARFKKSHTGRALSEAGPECS
jgi:excinuclease ABC subunit A